MDGDREATVAEIKDSIEQGKYLVDVRAVADAILRQLREIARASAERVTRPESSIRPDPQ